MSRSPYPDAPIDLDPGRPALSRRSILGAMGAAAALPALAPLSVLAQERLRQAHIVVAFPAGGATDAVARLVAEALQGDYANAMIVENRAGAGGRLGTEYVARAPADGSVLLYTPAFPLAISPHIYSKLGYDSRKDFAPVARTTLGTLSLSVGPMVPPGVKTLPAFVQWCKDNPDKASYGAPSGSGQHFAGALFAKAAGIPLTLVSYKGGAPSVIDLLGGHIAATVNPLVEVLPHVQAGKLRLLATTGKQRSKFTPDTPTMQEFGYEEVVFQDYSGVFAPAGTPKARIDHAHRAINKLLQSEQSVEVLAKLGTEAGPITNAEFTTDVKETWERYRRIVADTGFKAEE